MNNLTKLILAGTGLLLGSIAAAENPFTPAHFGYEEEDKKLVSRLYFPDIKGDVDVKLLCFTQLETNGKMKNTGCMAEDQFDAPFAQAISEAAKKARMTPATIGGKKVKVFVQFGAQFTQKGEDRQVKLTLNPGYPENVEAYGEEHVAAQRVIGKREPWQDVCPTRARFVVWAIAYVGENGESDSPSINHADGVLPTAACQESIMETIVASSYVPAIVDGVAVPSTFVELFSN